jgi:DNA topoisomerase IB
MNAADVSEQLRRSDPNVPGIRRRRCGRGFRYLGPDARPVRDGDTLSRIKTLVIPPAWKDVWICLDPSGHIQAVGTDDAGRRQYRYHALWRVLQDQDKHDRVLEFGTALPRLRHTVSLHLAGSGLTKERVLAGAVRLIDLGFFRPGGEEYATENGTFGVATIRREHVTSSHGQLVFSYPAKGSQQREQAVVDRDVHAIVCSLKRRRHGGEGLFAYWAGRRWHDVDAADINQYLRDNTGGEFTAKDFRTWHATVLAAVALAVSERAADSERGRKRAEVRAVKEVAGYLGNTPAVARASYIDPRVIELYERGITMAPALRDLGKDAEFGEMATQGQAERAVIRLLTRPG